MFKMWELQLQGCCLLYYVRIQASRGAVNAERGSKGAAARWILQGYLPG